MFYGCFNDRATADHRVTVNDTVYRAFHDLNIISTELRVQNNINNQTYATMIILLIISITAHVYLCSFNSITAYSSL